MRMLNVIQMDTHIHAVATKVTLGMASNAPLRRTLVKVTHVMQMPSARQIRTLLRAHAMRALPATDLKYRQ